MCASESFSEASYIYIRNIKCISVTSSHLKKPTAVAAKPSMQVISISRKKSIYAIYYFKYTGLLISAIFQ